MNNFIEKALQPFLSFLLKLIENKQYKIIYFVLIILLFIIVFLIWILSKIIANKKINSELKKNNEERKAKQIENFQKLNEVREKYISDLKNTQQIIRNISISIKQKDISKISQYIKSCRNSIFNDLLSSFEKYLEIYLIVYESKKYRFLELFTYEYIPLMKQLEKILNIINNNKLLSKISLSSYFIDNYVLAKKYNYMKNNISLFHLKKRYTNWKIQKDLLDRYGKK